MKILKILTLVSATVALIFCSCNGKEITISLSQETAELLNVGSVVELTATLTPTNATSEIVWASSDNTIATVASLNGKTAVVTAVGAGEAIITATANGHEASCRVKVTLEATFAIQHGVIEGDEVVYVNITDGSEIIITDYEQGSPRDPKKFEFLGRILSENAINMSVTLTRDTPEGDWDEFCSESCWVSNGETVQTFTWDFIPTSQDIYAHCYMSATGDDTIIYDFVDNAQPDVHIKIKVIYRSR
jgi:hypothetical protein